MVWFILSQKRRRRLVDDATRSRSNVFQRKAAVAAVIAYNFVGLFDIFSTVFGIGLGGVEEANPLLRMAMASVGPGWIAAKLLLQSVITVMVLWFPHRIVLAIFAAAVAFNAVIVWNNLHVAGVF